MKVLVLSCSTGGGHNACAKYIVEEFKNNGIKCDYINYLELIGEKTAKLVEKLYLDSTKGKGNIFKNVYKLGEIYNKSNIKSPVYLLNKLAKDKVLGFIKENKYTMVICTHLFPSMCITEIKKEYDIRLINVATDYECIPFWNETNPDKFIIPSKLVSKSFINKGFKKDLLLPIGIPVSSKFLEINNKVDIPQDKDIVMVVSGSMGFGNMTSLIKKILDRINNVYFLVICGNNKKLQSELESINNHNLIVKGFVNNMNEYMNVSKVIITKPGGLTSTEVGVIEKPLIHMMPIPGVENYNANFFADNNMSLKANKEEEVINSLELLLNNPKLQDIMVKNQKKYINQHSAADLVKYVLDNY